MEGTVVDYVKIAKTHAYFDLAVFGVNGSSLFFFWGVSGSPCYVVDIAKSVNVDHVGVSGGEDQVLERLGKPLVDDPGRKGTGLTDVTMCHGSMKIIDATIQRT